MIEYIKLGTAFGIVCFDIFFFPQDNQESAKKYIEDKVKIRL